jgi:hypothetical protein
MNHLSQEDFLKLSFILDLFYKERTIDEKSRYPKGFNPLMCVFNRELIDPKYDYMTGQKWNCIEEDSLKEIITRVFAISHKQMQKDPIVYTRDPHNDIVHIGHYSPADHSYNKYKIIDIEKVLELFVIHRNKPRGYYITCAYPEDTFVENEVIQKELEKYILRDDNYITENIYLIKVEEILVSKLAPAMSQTS